MDADKESQEQRRCDTLAIAEFADIDAAMRGYEALRGAEAGHRLRVDGAVAVSSDADGSITIAEAPDHATSTGLKWGAVGGLVVGVVFPPAILASTIAWGAVGGVLGKLRNSHHKSDLAEGLGGAVGPGKAGVVALIDGSARWVADQSFVEASNVTYVAVDDASVTDITEAARQAG